MRKRIVAGVAFCFGIFSIGGAACSSSSNGAAPIDASSDARIYPPPGDAAVPCGGGDIFDRSSVLTFTTPPLPPVANQEKCASDDLVSQFLAACNPFRDVDAADAGDICDAFISANADCARCLGGYSAPDASAPPNSPWPALLQIDQQGHTIPNVAACVAAISTGADTCKSNYANDDLCAESGCGPWFGAPEYAECYYAETSDYACPQSTTCLYDNPIDAACQAAIAAVSPTDADAKCGASTQIQSDADFELVFLKVGRTLCE